MHIRMCLYDVVSSSTMIIKAINDALSHDDDGGFVLLVIGSTVMLYKPPQQNKVVLHKNDIACCVLDTSRSCVSQSVVHRVNNPKYNRSANRLP